MYLGIDIGTSAVKVVLVDGNGAIIKTASSELAISRPKPGHSEQAPDWWWEATNDAVSLLQNTHQAALSKVAAIGLSGQMHGLVALDKEGHVLRPAILWNDTRCAAEAAALDAEYPAFRARGGNAVMAGFTAPKAEWMRRHEPDLFAQIETILLPKDYVRFRLSGEMVAEMSDAAGTLWLDVERRCWSEELLTACGLRLSQMPRLVEGSDKSATLSAALAAKWGMGSEVIIAGGGGDNAAAAIGLGVTSPGQGFVSLGTSGVVFTVTDRFAPAAESGAHAFCHAVPQTWHQMGVILAASDCVSWLCEITGQSVEVLMSEMATTDPLQTVPLFHPYLSGERTPHNDADARGGFYGLSRNHHKGDMARAVLQGVSFAIADAFEVLEGAGGAPSFMLATGGGSQNHQWLAYIASLTNCPIHVPVEAESGAALGAARLAMLADGLPMDGVCTRPDIQKTIMPDEAIAKSLAPARATAQQLYRAMGLLRDAQRKVNQT